MPKRRLVLVTLLLAGFTISACTAILVPNQDDDGVERCNTGDDCAPTGDERYVSVCVFGADQPENSDKICIADFKDDIGCDGSNYPATSRFFDVHDTATTNPGKAAYINCAMDKLGMQGCAPNAGACDSGLEVNEAGFCHDPNAPFPTINPTELEDIDKVAGQDVRDQFCRAFFCDEDFVCDTSTNTCKPCTDVDDFGEGGCGQLYLQGELSKVYQPIDESASTCGGAKPDDVANDASAFGDANEAPIP